jgi:hypothetical protein
MFHAPPLGAIDTAGAREHAQMMSKPEASDGDISPTFTRRDESPSGSFHNLDTDQARSTSLKGRTSEPGEPHSPADKVLPDTYVVYIYERGRGGSIVFKLIAVSSFSS